LGKKHWEEKVPKKEKVLLPIKRKQKAKKKEKRIPPCEKNQGAVISKRSTNT